MPVHGSVGETCAMTDRSDTEELEIRLPTILFALIVALLFAAAAYVGEA